MRHHERTERRDRRAVAILLAVLAFGALAATARADPHFGFGPGAPADGAPWSYCTTPDDQYCIASATIDGASLPPGSAASVSILGSDPTLPSSVNWAIHGPPGGAIWSLPAIGDAQLVLRVGRFVPRYTTATADGLVVSTATDGAGDTTLTLTGRVARVDWTDTDPGAPDYHGCAVADCGDATTAAAFTGLVFSGNTQDLGGDGWADDRDRFTGMVIASNAQAKSTVVLYQAFPDQQWLYSVANPHLRADGTTPATGSFTAYVPPNYFTASGIDPESTVLKVLRSDAGGDPFEIAATATADDAGGVTLRIDDLSYSSPALAVRSVAAHRVTVSRSGSGVGTVTSTAAGIDCGATCSSLFAAGDNVSLTATAAPGSVFKGWSGACSGASTTCLLAAIDGDRSATARFAAPPARPTVRWSANRRTHRVVALVTPVSGAAYRLAATRKGRTRTGTCTTRGAKVRCAVRLAAGWWTLRVVATRDGLASAAATKRLRA